MHGGCVLTLGRRSVSDAWPCGVLNIPNLLTILRILLIPCFLILLTDDRPGLALVVFALAGLTDGLDGAIARLTDSKTRLGAYLDPLADKALLLSAFIALAFMGAVPRWLTVLVISRDVLILAGYVLLFVIADQAMEVRPSVMGKLSTFFQLTAVCFVLFDLQYSAPSVARVLPVSFSLAGAVTAASGLQYLYRGLAWLQAGAGEETQRQPDRPPEAP